MARLEDGEGLAPAGQDEARVGRRQARGGQQRVGRELRPLQRQQRRGLREARAALARARGAGAGPGRQAARAPLHQQPALARVRVLQHALLGARRQLAHHARQQRVGRARRQLRPRRLQQHVQRQRQQVRVVLQFVCTDTPSRSSFSGWRGSRVDDNSRPAETKP